MYKVDIRHQDVEFQVPSFRKALEILEDYAKRINVPIDFVVIADCDESDEYE